jgi:hypothetical protein
MPPPPSSRFARAPFILGRLGLAAPIIMEVFFSFQVP